MRPQGAEDLGEDVQQHPHSLRIRLFDVFGSHFDSRMGLTLGGMLVKAAL